MKAPTSVSSPSQENGNSYLFSKHIPDAAWYGIYTRPRFEKKLYQALSKAKFHAFLPLTQEKRIWSDRVKSITVPLLPGYLFVYTPIKDFPLIYPMPGFVRMVSSEGKPCPIKEQEIALLEHIVFNGLPIMQTDPFVVGDKVRVIRGPLKGWEGIVQQVQGNSRVIFHIRSIQQALSVGVKSGDIEKMG